MFWWWWWWRALTHYTLLNPMLLESWGKFYSYRITCLSFTAKQHCTILPNSWSRWGLVLKCKKKQQKKKTNVEWLHTVCATLSKSQEAQRSKIDLKRCYVRQNHLCSSQAKIVCMHPVLCFETGLIQMCRGVLQHCSAVKLQKCFGDYVTSPDFPSAWGWEDNDRFFI